MTPPNDACLAPHTVQLEPALCCLCGIEDAVPIAVGEDFEYRTSQDSYLGVQCRRCSMVYLNPRPSITSFDQIYPDHYHAFAFDQQQFGFVHRVRRRLEARRVLKWCRGLPDNARILDVGCGDGFHLGLLKDFGPKTWELVGLDADPRAVAAAKKKGLNVHAGLLQSIVGQHEPYDLIMLIMTIEHVPNPKEMLHQVYQLLKPGGRLVIVTDNSASLDSWIFRGRHWGGYHFPRHLYLFNKKNLAALANAVALRPVKVRTAMSPVNWVYSIRNLLDDWGYPRWLVNRFSLKSVGSLACFTMLDQLFTVFNRGSILHGIFERVKPLGVNDE